MTRKRELFFNLPNNGRGGDMKKKRRSFAALQEKHRKATVRCEALERELRKMEEAYYDLLRKYRELQQYG
jgi:hypothetical protein